MQSVDGSQLEYPKGNVSFRLTSAINSIFIEKFIYRLYYFMVITRSLEAI